MTAVCGVVVVRSVAVVVVAEVVSSSAGRSATKARTMATKPTAMMAIRLPALT